MTREHLNDIDLNLVDRARKLIDLRRKEDKHAVSAVLITKSGKVVEGVHLEATVGRVAVCAEAIAIGSAAVAGDTEIAAIVAVYHSGKIVSPCGMCREMIMDYSPDAKVILADEQGKFKTRIGELLPMKYAR
jgi:cytidine deaminase